MVITWRIARIASKGYFRDTKPVGDGESEIRMFYFWRALQIPSVAMHPAGQS